MKWVVVHARDRGRVLGGLITLNAFEADSYVSAARFVVGTFELRSHQRDALMDRWESWFAEKEWDLQEMRAAPVQSRSELQEQAGMQRLAEQWLKHSTDNQALRTALVSTRRAWDMTVVVIAPPGLSQTEIGEEWLKAEMLLNEHSKLRFHFKAPEWFGETPKE